MADTEQQREQDGQWWWKCACGSEGRKRWPTRRAAEIKAAAHDRKCGGYAEVTCTDPYQDTSDAFLRRGHDRCLWCRKPATRFCDAEVAVRYDYRRILCDAPLCDECTSTTHTTHPEISWDRCPHCDQMGERSGVRKTVFDRPCDLEHDELLMEDVAHHRRKQMGIVRG